MPVPIIPEFSIDKKRIQPEEAMDKQAPPPETKAPIPQTQAPPSESTKAPTNLSMDEILAKMAALGEKGQTSEENAKEPSLKEKALFKQEESELKSQHKERFERLGKILDGDEETLRGRDIFDVKATETLPSKYVEGVKNFFDTISDKEGIKNFFKNIPDMSSSLFKPNGEQDPKWKRFGGSGTWGESMDTVEEYDKTRLVQKVAAPGAKEVESLEKELTKEEQKKAIAYSSGSQTDIGAMEETLLKQLNEIEPDKEIRDKIEKTIAAINNMVQTDVTGFAYLEIKKGGEDSWTSPKNYNDNVGPEEASNVGFDAMMKTDCMILKNAEFPQKGAIFEVADERWKARMAGYGVGSAADEVDIFEP